MKFCILMWYDETISAYADINYKINKAYCDKNNIELIKCSERRYSNRHPAWERIPLILKHIPNYDYVMWIDADAHFYINSKNIKDYIDNINNINYNFIFSKDIKVAINTGCFIVKNTQYSIDFLTKWGYDETLYKNNKYPNFWENGVILDMYKENILDIKNNSLVIDYGVLQHFYEKELIKLTPKPFIFHLAGRNSKIRYSHSLDYFTKMTQNLKK
jgi:hypothetical protein